MIGIWNKELFKKAFPEDCAHPDLFKFGWMHAEQGLPSLPPCGPGDSFAPVYYQGRNAAYSTGAATPPENKSGREQRRFELACAALEGFCSYAGPVNEPHGSLGPACWRVADAVLDAEKDRGAAA